MRFQMQKTAILSNIILSLMIVCLILPAVSEVKAETKPWQTEKQSLKIARDSLKRLEKAIKKDEFYSARCALNIWRSNAQDAGIFDPVQYDDFKKQIYQKSIGSILYWLRICINKGWIREADFWLRVYTVRSAAIDVFDQARYDRTEAEIKAKKKQIAEEKERREKRKRKRKK